MLPIIPMVPKLKSEINFRLLGLFMRSIMFLVIVYYV